MPRGVPYRVQLAGKPRTYTFTEIADGTGLSLALVSRVMRGEWPVSLYTQDRLRAFFGIPDGESCTINVGTPPPRRPRGRLIGYKYPHGRIVGHQDGRPVIIAPLGWKPNS